MVDGCWLLIVGLRLEIGRGCSHGAFMRQERWATSRNNLWFNEAFLLSQSPLTPTSKMSCILLTNSCGMADISRILPTSFPHPLLSLAWTGHRRLRRGGSGGEGRRWGARCKGDRSQANEGWMGPSVGGEPTGCGYWSGEESLSLPGWATHNSIT